MHNVKSLDKFFFYFQNYMGDLNFVKKFNGSTLFMPGGKKVICA